MEKKKLEKDIKKLDKHEYIEILNIIKKNNQHYSQNSKGIFFNLKYINEKTIKDMIKFIEFCKKNTAFLEEDYTVDKPVQYKKDSKKELYDSYNLEDLDITIDIKNFIKSKDNKSNNFTFKNYLDKISIVPKKEFINKQSEKYPDLININTEFTGTNNRILKKCKNYESSYSKSNETSALEYNNILEAEVHI